jgi:cell division protein FtsQ
MKGNGARPWLMVGMVVGAALVAGGVWWAAQQPLPEFSYFQVNEIQIRGNDHVATEEVLSRLGLQEPVNILQLDMEELAGRIMAHPWIRSASIQRHPPLRLIVTVEERQPVALLSAGKTYLLSADAVILEEVEGPPAQDLPTLRTQWRAKYRAGEHLDEPRILRGLELLEVLRKAPPLQQAQVKEVTAEADGNYIVHLAGEGAILRLSVAAALPQLHRLDVALGRRGQRLENFAYVDLRFPERVILNPSEKGG